MIRFETTAADFVGISRQALERLLPMDGCAVKVYLYGLVRGGADAEQISAELKIKKTDVQRAVDALAEAGLLSISQGGETQLVYAPPVCAPEEDAGAAVYEDGEFNVMLQAIFADRQLSYSDYKTFYEFIDVYGLPKPVVLMLAEFAITGSRARNRVSMAALRDIAKDWAHSGVDTIERAQRRMEEGGTNAGAAREVLRALGITRQPSDEEQRLYEKWVRDWGFSFGAIKAAMAETAKIQYPNMKYLDGILASLHEKNKLTSVEVNSYFDETRKTNECVKRLLKILGAPRLTVTAASRALYHKWTGLGFAPDALDFACAYAAANGSPTMEFADKLLVGWSVKRLKTREDIEGYLQAREEKRARIEQMLQSAGINKQLTAGDEACYDRFTEKYGMPHEVVLFAAHEACGLAAPIKAMEKMLARWSEAGAKTLPAAQRENDRFRAAVPQKGAPEHGMIERAYAEGELSGKIVDPLKDMEV